MYEKGTTAYLGDEYSYSYAAAKRMTDGKLIAFDSIRSAIDAVGVLVDRAVVPVENNVEGAVNEVYDALFDCKLDITHQLVLPIRHCLIAAAGANMQLIRRITSHPQALAQCRKFVQKLGVPAMPVASTSAALAAASETTAAIAHAPRPDQVVLARDIQDSAFNATRFALLERGAAMKGGNVSAAFDLQNTHGALLSVLRIIDAHGVNLTRILSRPHRNGDGKYRFFIDFDFDGENAALDELITELCGACEAFRFLGRYDVETAETL